ncbi:MAG: NAD(P)H-hydrate epimerase [Phycisphaerae bacterium]|nr:NAD(P)H-hydrate epimerase [Phycisphaerae bacterium]
MKKTPTLTREQCRAVDRYAIEQLGIPGVVLMENAGRNAADLIERWLRRGVSESSPSKSRPSPRVEPRPDHVAVVCGKGNNGGDGFVIARHLIHRGYQVGVVLLGDPGTLAGDAAANHAVLVRMGVRIRPLTESSLAPAVRTWRQCSIVVDALLGTGFAGQVQGLLAKVIEAVNSLAGPTIVAVDVPSGLDADTGEPGGAAIRANHTVTFLATKTGYLRPTARHYLGRVHVVDIGAPTQLILARLGSEK